MRALKNFEKSSANKNPRLKCRYATGLGDLIACILHSRYIGKITHFITGLDQPCQTCSNRAMALNILFPIPFWKLFFKSDLELTKHLSKELKKAGYDVETTPDGKGLSSFKVTEKPFVIESEKNQTPFTPTFNSLEHYNEIGSSDNYIGEFLIRTLIYKQNGNTNS